MNVKSTAEMIRADQAVLGIDYGLAYYHSYQELWRVSSNWDRYEALFGTEKRVSLLNESGGTFWYEIQNMLFEHVLLGLCRLTDPAGCGKKKNLSIWRLVELDFSTHNRRLYQRATNASRCTEFARTWRDKRIAHNDLEQISGAANKLLPATRKKVTAAIISIHDVLRWIYAKHFNGEIYLFEIGDSDAIAVMSTIFEGSRFAQLRSQAWSRGDFDTSFNYDYSWMDGAPRPRERYKRQQKLKLPKDRN